MNTLALKNNALLGRLLDVGRRSSPVNISPWDVVVSLYFCAICFMQCYFHAAI